MSFLAAAGHKCPPFRFRQPGHAGLAGTCSACQLRVGGYLEQHKEGGGRPERLLCPLCHACQHLDVAGQMNAGKLIWLPELSQERLNLTCVAIFLGAISGVETPEIEKMKVLYRTMETRDQPLARMLTGGGAPSALLLGAAAAKAPSLPFDVCNPAFIAQQMQRRAVSDAQLAGLRLLPYPAAFMKPLRAWLKEVTAKMPVENWASLAIADAAGDDDVASLGSNAQGGGDA